MTLAQLLALFIVGVAALQQRLGALGFAQLVWCALCLAECYALHRDHQVRWVEPDRLVTGGRLGWELLWLFGSIPLVCLPGVWATLAPLVPLLVIVHGHNRCRPVFRLEGSAIHWSDGCVWPDGPGLSVEHRRSWRLGDCLALRRGSEIRVLAARQPGLAELARELARRIGCSVDELRERPPQRTRARACLPRKRPRGMAFFLLDLPMLGACAGFSALSVAWLLEAPRQLFAWPTTAFCGWLTFAFASSWCLPARCRLIPLYSGPVPGSDTYQSGWALAYNGQRLPELAEFGYADPLLGESLTWHDPARGIEVLCQLQRRLDSDCRDLDGADDVLLELQRLKRGLELASAQQRRFALLLDDDGGTSTTVWERRGGRPF